MKVAYK